MRSIQRRPRIDNPFLESGRVLGIYVKAQVTIIGIVALMYAAGFALAHMPFWYVIAVLAGVCYAIPHFGSLIGLAIAGVAGFFGDANLLTVFATWVVVQGVEGFYLTPRLLGRPLGLRPLLVFVTLIAASFLFGPFGFLLAVPILAVGNVFWRYFRER